MSEETKPNVLDVRLLVHIEAVHRGFLYGYARTSALSRLLCVPCRGVVRQLPAHIAFHTGHNTSKQLKSPLLFGAFGRP
jgi:hypothetical protein